MSSVEERLAKVEKEVAELKAKAQGEISRPGWSRKVEGSFVNDPVYDEILRLGREERQSDLVNDE